jgi:hypothetical protein
MNTWEAAGAILGPRMVHTLCGIVGAAARRNW